MLLNVAMVVVVPFGLTLRSATLTEMRVVPVFPTTLAVIVALPRLLMCRSMKIDAVWDQNGSKEIGSLSIEFNSPALTTDENPNVAMVAMKKKANTASTLLIDRKINHIHSNINFDGKSVDASPSVYITLADKIL
jgi:hypothetical protein